MKTPVFGTNNRVLEIDLSSQSFEIIHIRNEERIKYLGGKGLALKLLYDRMEIGVDPLGEKNMIAIMTGVYTGTSAPCSSRFSAVTKSPLTGIFCHSSCGGPFGEKLKSTGWDGIILKGKSNKKSYLLITDKSAEFKDAKKLWGKGTIETQEILNKEGTSCVIGPAGENQVLYANIASGERYLGRGGMGAVLGAKNIKGIVVKEGDLKFVPAHDHKFNQTKKKAVKYLKTNLHIKTYKKYGTNAKISLNNDAEILPVKNFTKGKTGEAYKITGEYIKENHQTTFHACNHCEILCGKKGLFNGELLSVPEFEATVHLGSNINIFDMNRIAQWNQICGDMGMDVISTGGTIAWVMEASEKGFVESPFKFGSTEGITDALFDIARARGGGVEMGFGSRILSEKYGGKDFAIQVKGLEMTGCDPRGSYGQGLAYATANRGACHLSTSLMVLENHLHFLDPYTTENKPVIVKYFEDLYSAMDSLQVCPLTSYAYIAETPLLKKVPLPVIRKMMALFPKPTLQTINLSIYSKFWSAITGFKLSMWNFLKAGERIHTLERHMNTREGISRGDDTLPGRLLNEGREHDPFGRHVPLSDMLDQYYKIRGYDPNGIPTNTLLFKLGLKRYP